MDGGMGGVKTPWERAAKWRAGGWLAEALDVTTTEEVPDI